MDNIGEIAYLIIVALIFVAQTIFGKKKKGPAKRPKPNPRPAADPFEDIFGELFGQKEEVKPPVTPPTNEPATQPVFESGRVVSTEANIDTTPFGRYTQRNQTYSRKTESGLDFNSPALQVEHLDDENEGVDIDLREAIINQIILERKFKW